MPRSRPCSARRRARPPRADLSRAAAVDRGLGMHRSVRRRPGPRCVGLAAGGPAQRTETEWGSAVPGESRDLGCRRARMRPTATPPCSERLCHLPADPRWLRLGTKPSALRNDPGTAGFGASSFGKGLVLTHQSDDLGGHVVAQGALAAAETLVVPGGHRVGGLSRQTVPLGQGAHRRPERGAPVVQSALRGVTADLVDLSPWQESAIGDPLAHPLSLNPAAAPFRYFKSSWTSSFVQPVEGASRPRPLSSTSSSANEVTRPSSSVPARTWGGFLDRRILDADF